jgi:uncharacterized OsmC-like protein
MIMSEISVTHQHRDAFRVDVRGHSLLVDQPGEGEVGPTPVELFVASLAACAAHYAVGFLRRHDLPHEGLRVRCEWKMRAAEKPRAARVVMSVIPPEPVSADLVAPLLAAIDECTVKNSLAPAPTIEVEVATVVPVG